MGLIAKETTSNFKPVPPGMHLARCFKVIDLGTQRSEWLGEIKDRNMIMLQWEVHSEDEDGNPLITPNGEPMAISKNYSNTLSPKSALRLHLSSWRGRDFTPVELKGFELKSLLGVWCMLTVKASLGKDGKEYTNVDSVNPVPAAVKAAGFPMPFSKPEMFDMEKPDMEVFGRLNERLKAKIMSAPEWGRLSSSSNDLDSDIPF